MEVIERTGTSVDEIALAAQALVSDGVEAVFTPTDNTVMKSELTIYETFAEAGNRGRKEGLSGNADAFFDL